MLELCDLQSCVCAERLTLLLSCTVLELICALCALVIDRIHSSRAQAAVHATEQLCVAQQSVTQFYPVCTATVVLHAWLQLSCVIRAVVHATAVYVCELHSSIPCVRYRVV